MEHLLKLEHARATDPRPGWMRTFANGRAEIADRVTPTIRRDVEANPQRLYTQARREAALALAEHDELEGAASLPEACPYTLARLLDEDRLPRSRSGPSEHA